jgi:hypothetical protein
MSALSSASRMWGQVGVATLWEAASDARGEARSGADIASPGRPPRSSAMYGLTCRAIGASSAMRKFCGQVSGEPRSVWNQPKACMHAAISLSPGKGRRRSEALLTSAPDIRWPLASHDPQHSLQETCRLTRRREMVCARRHPRLTSLDTGCVTRIVCKEEKGIGAIQQALLVLCGMWATER